MQNNHLSQKKRLVEMFSSFLAWLTLICPPPPNNTAHHFRLHFAFLSLPPSVLRGAVTALAVTASAAQCDQSWLAVVYRDMHPINNMNLQAGGGHDIQPLPLTCFRVHSYTRTQAEGSHTCWADKKPPLLWQDGDEVRMDGWVDGWIDEWMAGNGESWMVQMP